VTLKLTNLLKEADALSRDEQLLLMSHLAERNRGLSMRPGVPSYRWQDARGSAIAQMTGEDAQAWVTRSRRDDQRKRDGQ
jgi:hypothetical protein